MQKDWSDELSWVFGIVLLLLMFKCAGVSLW